MSSYDGFSEHNGDRPRETLDEAVKRLRGELASGSLFVRPELAELLMRQAHFAAESTRLSDAINLVDESIAIADQLVDEGQVEFKLSAVRCRMFRTVLIRAQKGAEAALPEHNEVIRYINDNISPEDPNGLNMLAITLMNKSEILNHPIGAASAAAAAQEQAARIWEQLVDNGSTVFRPQLVAALLSLGNTHVQMGDAVTGLADFQRGLNSIREGMENRMPDDETDYTGFLIQALMNISKMQERLGNIHEAVVHVNEAIDTVVNLVTSGQPQVMPVLTTMYQHRGMLQEKANHLNEALDDFERARDIFRQSLRQGQLGTPGDYVVRTGLANLLMCCANIYTDMHRFDDAELTYNEAIRVYQQASEFRPVGDEDETFIPYSIGVIRLNYANMLVARERYQDAINLQTQAISALKSRFIEGHPEILPNLVSAFRKMISTYRALDDYDKMFGIFYELIGLLEAAVDDGNFEYRSELAAVFMLKSIANKEIGNIDDAIEDSKRAMRIFRAIADDEIDMLDTPWSNLQWGETLTEIAQLYLLQNRQTEAFDYFRQQIDININNNDDNNRNRVFDILYGYSQYVEFVAKYIQNDTEPKPIKDNLRQIAEDTIKIINKGLHLIDKTFPMKPVKIKEMNLSKNAESVSQSFTETWNTNDIHKNVTRIDTFEIDSEIKKAKAKNIENKSKNYELSLERDANNYDKNAGEKIYKGYVSVVKKNLTRKAKFTVASLETGQLRITADQNTEIIVKGYASPKEIADAQADPDLHFDMTVVAETLARTITVFEEAKAKDNSISKVNVKIEAVPNAKNNNKTDANIKTSNTINIDDRIIAAADKNKIQIDQKINKQKTKNNNKDKSENNIKNDTQTNNGKIETGEIADDKIKNDFDKASIAVEEVGIGDDVDNVAFDNMIDSIVKKDEHKEDHKEDQEAKSGGEFGFKDVQEDPAVYLFFRMKQAFFWQMRGCLLQGIGDFDSAVVDYELAVNCWELLLSELDKLLLQKRYYVRELESLRAMERERHFDSNNKEFLEKVLEIEQRVRSSEFFEDRWRYYASELRINLQRWALAELLMGRVNRAEAVYLRDIDSARDMLKRNVPSADRYLVMSLLSYAKAMDVAMRIDKSRRGFAEVISLIENRIKSGDHCTDDFEMLKHASFVFAMFLAKNKMIKSAKEVINEYLKILDQNIQPLPEWSIWRDLCDLSEIETLTEEFEPRRVKILNKHPHAVIEAVESNESNEKKDEQPENTKPKNENKNKKNITPPEPTTKKSTKEPKETES
ncbi:MAG: tetratricopeptide repeat protein [Planctomycetaceae bacterium]|jgi:tetratricopeptide (TPR) repeat protein|nr:tetratricopeptide repeat protein [Planctomycetaceae bacterium]